MALDFNLKKTNKKTGQNKNTGQIPMKVGKKNWSSREIFKALIPKTDCTTSHFKLDKSLLLVYSHLQKEKTNEQAKKKVYRLCPSCILSKQKTIVIP